MSIPTSPTSVRSLLWFASVSGAYEFAQHSPEAQSSRHMHKQATKQQRITMRAVAHPTPNSLMGQVKRLSQCLATSSATLLDPSISLSLQPSTKLEKKKKAGFFVHLEKGVCAHECGVEASIVHVFQYLHHLVERAADGVMISIGPEEAALVDAHAEGASSCREDVFVSDVELS